MSGRYRLIRQIASGGMAEVYLGVATGEEGFARPVAIKRIHPHLAQHPEVSRLFLGEVVLAARLQHQNVVQVFDVGRSEGNLFIVMELVNGWDLADVLDGLQPSRAGIPPHLVGYIAAQVVSGLRHAFRGSAAGEPVLLAHRDISPSNVLLSVEGEVKVADFGVAKISEHHGGSRFGGFKGKEAYSAPEILNEEPATLFSDQFSLGLVLAELLTGQHPYGQREQYGKAIRTTAAPLPPGAPPALAAILGRLLARAPQERYPDMDSLGRDLALYLSQTGQPASAAELAAYLRTLPLAPPFAERGGQELPQAATFSLSAGGSSGAPTAPSPAASGLPDDFYDAWQPLGKTLGADGTISGETGPPPAPVPLAEPVPAPLELARTPVSEAEGHSLELEHNASAPPQPSTQPRVAPRVKAAPADAPRWGPPPKASGLGAGAIVAWLVVLAIMGGGAALFFSQRSSLTRPFAERPLLYIDSHPSGATVHVDGVEIGQTPLVQENLYGGSVSYQLTLKGYRPYSGSFTGGQPVKIDAPLKRP